MFVSKNCRALLDNYRAIALKKLGLKNENCYAKQVRCGWREQYEILNPEGNMANELYRKEDYKPFGSHVRFLST